MAVPVTQRFDITLKQRTSFNAVIATLRDPDSNELFDLSGYTARAEVRPIAGHASYLLSLSSKISVDAQGRVTLTMTPTDTAALVRRGHYDVILTSANGLIAFVAVMGTFSILPTVTAPPAP